MKASACLALTTCPSEDVAQKLASELVKRRLAACVNIIPGITSVYSWQGQVNQDAECKLLIKTRQDVVQAAYNCVIELHPYDVPEWMIIIVAGGSEDYLSWLDNSIKT
ncbi:divalent-cation tolerance protein CutA [Aestuariibacter salexigens]|uniref:divalent-cation tolerance protein CutA n=1 Tax=Aestuariibacter salexigens TaxID=226010 RepID=UPI000404369F|nr:divalent-cation tolerance protein CutA [Aestuariibacter salexigens]